jgi:hypothetical protein
MVEKLEKEIHVLVCQLEKVFPPGWFNPMQHLLVHIPYEAKVGGPMQYRWMYAIERALKGITYFSSVYLVEEDNVNAPIM